MSSFLSIENLPLDKEQPVRDVRLLSDAVAQLYGTLRFPMMLVWVFAALALPLSAVGIFGLMSYTVSRRSQELAVLMALGGDRPAVMRLILREGLGVTLTGVLIGLAFSLGLSGVMAGYVYGIRSTDPLTYAVRCAGARGDRSIGVLRSCAPDRSHSTDAGVASGVIARGYIDVIAARGTGCCRRRADIQPSRRRHRR